MSNETKTLPVALKVKKRQNAFVILVKRLFKEKPLGSIGFIIIMLLIFTAIFADFISPQKPVGTRVAYNVTHLSDRLKGPSAQYWLGTDTLGRDVMTRVIFGARLSILVSFSATAIATILSTIIGISCAYFGGPYDLFMQRFVDAWNCFPMLVVLLTLLAVVGPGLIQMILILGISSGIGGARGPRGLVFMIKNNLYVYASQAVGATSGRIMWKHLFPNISPMIIIGFTAGIGGMVMAEASLSYLGYGLPPPNPSWGTMINQSVSVITNQPWLVIAPGIALSLVVFGINVFGDALRDLLDPRMRGGLGGFGKFSEKKSEKLKKQVMNESH